MNHSENATAVWYGGLCINKHDKLPHKYVLQTHLALYTHNLYWAGTVNHSTNNEQTKVMGAPY